MTDSSVRSIQRRLFLLLLRSFAIVVGLILTLILATTAILLIFPSQFNPAERTPTITRLETFYLVRGSWEGVSVIIPQGKIAEHDDLWRNAILVDANGQIIVYRGNANAPQVGQTYVSSQGEIRIPIRNNGREVGALIYAPGLLPNNERQIGIGFLAPVGLISFFLAILTLVIGMFLTRRVVVPLSEVIAAARAVAEGDLSARVPVSGPDDLRALSDSFNQMASALERSDQQRRNLLADVAHELRTPLTVIRGRLEGIVDGIYPPNEKQIIPALEETYLLERLVEDLRLLTLAETRQLHFEPRLVSLNDLAAHAIELFAAEASEKKINLRLEQPEQIIQANIDPQRTGQVLANLVSNALRYVPAGGEVTLSIEQNNEEIRLNVADNGPGVTPEDLPHLFERFWRGEKSRSRASGGAGLGLAIAKQLVEAQGGQIQAQNRAEGGLSIAITFKK